MQEREPGPAVKGAPEADRRMRILAGLGLMALHFAASAGRMHVEGVSEEGLRLLGIRTFSSPWELVGKVRDTVVREFGE